MSFKKIQQELTSYIDKEKAEIYARFFKTGKGEYGEGDIFLGITVPHIRKIAKKYKHADFDTIKQLLESPYHEHRMTGLFILVYKFESLSKVKTRHASSHQITQNISQKKIYNFYIKNIRYVNNWDLVDTTTPHIMGAYLYAHPEKKDILYTFAKSKNLWKKRISIISTFTFIRNNDFADTLAISEILLHDHHDLIHKAVGWMLREIGKKNQKILEQFLKKYYKTMPRTTLRYAIEKFDEKKRAFYMKK